MSRQYAFVFEAAITGPPENAPWQFQGEIFHSLNALSRGGYGILWIKGGLSREEKWEAARAIAMSEGIPVEKVFPSNPKGTDGLVKEVLLFLKDRDVDYEGSVAVGTDDSSLNFARELGVRYISLRSPDKKTDSNQISPWKKITLDLLSRDRLVTLSRTTRETRVEVTVNLDGSGASEINTGLPFFDHMLEQIARHGGIDLRIQSKGDLEIDEHHTVEDTAIVLGKAIKKALGEKRGIGRYGFTLPMDESLATCTMDLSGRAHLAYEVEIHREKIGGFPVELVKHFYQSLCQHAGINLHLHIKGENGHHIIESGFKAFARCFKQAVRRDGQILPSTKEVMD